jgi:transposase
VLRVDCARWGGTAEDLRHVALSAPHARTRERALALYEITQGSCATRVAACTGRHPQTVMGWVHAYNVQGPGTLAFRRTGGRPPFARRSQRRFVRPSAPPSARPRRRP